MVIMIILLIPIILILKVFFSEKHILIEFSVQLLDIFTPIFSEMEEQKLRLSRQDFIDATLKLYETLSNPDKKLILEYGNKKIVKKFEKQFSFEVFLFGFHRDFSLKLMKNQ